MSDTFPTLNAELEGFARTHKFFGKSEVADGIASGELPETRHRWPILLHVDIEGEEGVLNSITEGLSDIPEDEEPGLIRAYRNNYRQLIGELQLLHSSAMGAEKEEIVILSATMERMVDQDLHLLGGYVVGQTGPDNQVAGSMFYHTIFGEEYKRSIAANIAASGFDPSHLPSQDRTRIEAMMRMEDTYQTTLASVAMIANLMPAALEAFPDR